MYSLAYGLFSLRFPSQMKQTSKKKTTRVPNLVGVVIEDLFRVALSNENRGNQHLCIST
jgi:hypothetical protein